MTGGLLEHLYSVSENDFRQCWYWDLERGDDLGDGSTTSSPFTSRRVRSLRTLASYHLPPSLLQENQTIARHTQTVRLFSLPKKMLIRFVIDFKLGCTFNFQERLPERGRVKSSFLCSDVTAGGFPPGKIDILYSTLTRMGENCTFFVCKLSFMPSVKHIAAIFDFAINKCYDTVHARLYNCSKYVDYNLGLLYGFSPKKTVFRNIFLGAHICFDKTEKRAEERGVLRMMDRNSRDFKKISYELVIMRKKIETLFSRFSTGDLNIENNPSEHLEDVSHKYNDNICENKIITSEYLWL